MCHMQVNFEIPLISIAFFWAQRRGALSKYRSEPQKLLIRHCQKGIHMDTYLGFMRKPLLYWAF